MTGTIGLKLYKGSVRVVTRESPNAVYDAQLATFSESGGLFSQQASPGFIELWSLQSRLAWRLRNEHARVGHASMGYKILGYVVWNGGKWYLKPRYGRRTAARGARRSWARRVAVAALAVAGSRRNGAFVVTCGRGSHGCPGRDLVFRARMSQPPSEHGNVVDPDVAGRRAARGAPRSARTRRWSCGCSRPSGGWARSRPSATRCGRTLERPRARPARHAPARVGRAAAAPGGPGRGGGHARAGRPGRSRGCASGSPRPRPS